MTIVRSCHMCGAPTEWISADEPPQDDQMVLISVAFPDHFRMLFGFWHEGECSVYGATHWQPLPSPPTFFTSDVEH